MSAITVFCGSSLGCDDRFAVVATELGRAIAAGGHTLVYGGSNVGLMGQLANAALAADGHVVGVIPHNLGQREIRHDTLSETIVTDTMHERKAIMAERGDGFIALPGGYGTLDEVMEVLTWNQIGQIAKPVVFLDVDHYYEPLFTFLDHAVKTGLINENHRANAQYATTVGDAVERAISPAPASASKWASITE